MFIAAFINLIQSLSLVIIILHANSTKIDIMVVKVIISFINSFIVIL